MHRMHHAKAGSGPETTGRTIHWASEYDILSGLLGLGVNRSKSRMIVEMARIEPGDEVLDVACGTGSLTLTAQKVAGKSGSVYGIDASPEMIDAARKKAERSGLILLADFKAPANPVLAHIASALVGPAMMHYEVSAIPPMLTEAGFVDVASGPTRSAFLAFVSGKKPAS